MKNNGILYSTLKKVDVKLDSIPLNEYPSCLAKRDKNYIILNGTWDIEISKSEELPTNFSSKVVVPFAIETPASKVNHLLETDEIIYYHKVVKIDNLNCFSHLFLCFDGVDQIADIYINKEKVFTHIGGYTKFKVDIKKYVGNNSEFDLIVKVKDFTDSSFYSRGKQTLNPNNWFYTSSSGIYKSVYLVGLDDEYIEDIEYKTDFDKKEVSVLVKSNVNKEAKIIIENKEYKCLTNQFITISLKDNFHPWSVSSPYLYNVKVILNNDYVYSYFGIRKIETRKIDGKYYIYLNNNKLIINGLLDQGYYYLGFLTPLSYKDYEKDILNVKELGFNCLRKHIKVENDYFYYLCDKYGLLVIQDFPNGGTKYKLINNFKPGISYEIFNKERYLNYKGYGRKTIENREHFKEEVDQIYYSLKSFPSIIMFTIFNESWGEFDPSYFYKHFKELDDNQHIFDTASGWIDTTYSDVFSIHAYYFTSRKRKDPFSHRPYFLSETGGLGYKEKDHFDYPTFYGHRTSKTKDEYNKKFKKLYEKSIIPLLKEGIMCGVIYTQINDCEKEGNGIYTFDREVLKLDKEMVKSINDTINKI